MRMLQCFSTPIWIIEIKEHDSIDLELMGLINEIRNSGTKESAGVSRSNQGGGWQSDFIDISKTPIFQKALAGVMNDIASQINIRQNSRMMLGGCWANVNVMGGYNSLHTHPDSMFSGAYYVKTPHNCGRFVAHDPRPQAKCITLPIDSNTPLTSPAYNHLPQAGEFVIFPSWMPHHVEANMTENERISVAFNLFYVS